MNDLASTARFLSAFQNLSFVTQTEIEYSEQVINALKSDGTGFAWAEFFVQAARSGFTKVVRLFLTFDTNIVDLVNSRGDTALQSASVKGYDEIVADLLAADACVDKSDDADNSSLYYAAWYGRTKVVEKLLAANADVEKAGSNCRTPLFMAADHGRKKVVRKLLAAGAAVETFDLYGQTPLFAAAHWDRRKVVKILLEAGADVDQADRNGTTPLQIAAWVRNETIVEQLLAAGAQITPEIITCAHYAIVPILEQAARKREWNRLLNFAFVMRPLNLPVLVVYSVYKTAPFTSNYTVPLYFAWTLLKAVKQTRNSC